MCNIRQNVLLKELDQLHNIVMEFNKNSAELKKVYVGLLPVIATIIYKVNGNKFDSLDYSMIVLLTTTIFLIVEYHYYSNQTKIREAMRKTSEKLYSENKNKIKFESVKFMKANLIYILMLIIPILYA